MELKKCTKCGEYKKVTEEYFHRDSRAKNGYRASCKTCDLKHKKTYSKENREKLSKRRKASYQENREKILEKAKVYHKENRKKRIDKQSIYYQKNKEKISLREKKYREGIKERISKQKKEYWEKNKKTICKKNTIRQMNRRKIDPNYRMRLSLSARLLGALHGKRKGAPTLELLGCSIEHLRNHLESKFKLGMTWDNYGTVWHIDHIKPFAVFDDLSDLDQQREVCHYMNLQPLFVEDNLRKGSKWTG